MLVALIALAALQTAPAAEPTVLSDVVAVGEGRVTLECGVAPDRRLTDCRVLEETPQGVGFGEAALQAVGEARLTRRTVDSMAPGGRIRYTTRFRLDPDQAGSGEQVNPPLT